jgi:activating signal cointegrator 1
MTSQATILIQLQRIDGANRVLASFAVETRIERRRGGWYVVWTRNDRPTIARRWSTRGQGFYPPWSQLWGHGGTACTALSQLIRWLRGQPVLPISTWRYWASDRVQLLPLAAVEDLQSAGYPEHASCVLCGHKSTGSFDWWSLDGVSGPCCHWTSGCRQGTGSRRETGAPLYGLTIWEPWATLLALGHKRIETRPWAPPEHARGCFFAVHASKHWTPEQSRLARRKPFRDLLPDDWRCQDMERPRTLGTLVSVHQLADWYQMPPACPPIEKPPRWLVDLAEWEPALGDFRLGRWAWHLPLISKLEAPIPYRGLQGLWHVKDDRIRGKVSRAILAAIREQQRAVDEIAAADFEAAAAYEEVV